MNDKEIYINLLQRAFEEEQYYMCETLLARLYALQLTEEDQEYIHYVEDNIDCAS